MRRIECWKRPHPATRVLSARHSRLFKRIRQRRQEALVWALIGLCIGFLVSGGWGLFSIVAGWGLLNLKEWARWLALVLAIFSLFAFPVGTIIGVLIIWYLLQDEARNAFESAT